MRTIEINCRVCNKTISFKVEEKPRRNFPFPFIFHHGNPVHAILIHIDHEYKVRGYEIIDEFCGPSKIPIIISPNKQSQGKMDSIESTSPSIIHSESSEKSRVSNPFGTCNEIKPGLFLISLDRKKIEEIAYLISQQRKSWDECAWWFAELEMQLSPACGANKNVFSHGGLPDRVLLYPSKVVYNPVEADVRSLAFDISHRRPSLQDLHWFIAQRQYISNLVPHLN